MTVYKYLIFYLNSDKPPVRVESSCPFHIGEQITGDVGSSFYEIKDVLHSISGSITSVFVSDERFKKERADCLKRSDELDNG